MILVKLYQGQKCIFVCSMNCLKSFGHFSCDYCEDGEWVLTLTDGYEVHGSYVEFEELK